jgi:hypothetical protein
MPDRVASNSDELRAMMEEDERNDAVLLAPIEYAKARGIYPQQVYRAIRNKKLVPQYCNCGRKCVVVAEADEVFGFGRPGMADEEDVSSEEEVPGS